MKTEGRLRVELTELSKTYDSVHALVSLQAEFAPGSVVAVVGTNGAGKTTLLRCMAGLVAPSSGRVSYDGQHFERHRLDMRRRLMFIPSLPEVLGHMSVVAWLAAVLRLYEVDRPDMDAVAVELLHELDLVEVATRPMAVLSRGHLYKCALATLLAVDPPLWLLDEPFASGMDPLGIGTARRRIGEAASRGTTIVFTTQILEVAKSLATVVLVLDRGRQVACGPLEQIEKQYQGLEGVFDHLREQRV